MRGFASEKHDPRFIYAGGMVFAHHFKSPRRHTQFRKKSYLPSPHMQPEALHSLFASTLKSGTLWNMCKKCTLRTILRSTGAYVQVSDLARTRSQECNRG
jgi:hypothetical protein